MPRSEDPPDDSYSGLNAAVADMPTPNDVDELFACLADQQRRLLIECVAEHAGPLVIEELVQHISDREDGATPETQSKGALVETTIALLHQHLPKMDEARIIDVDHETNTVQEGEYFDVALAVLEVV